MAKAKNELKVKEQTAVAVVAPDFNFEADIGSGMEGADVDSFAIPFLRVLQPMSPQCTDGNAEYVEGARAGMLFNSVTGEVTPAKEGVTFLPCAFQRRFLRWAPRGSDGGFGGEYMPEDVARMRIDGGVIEVDGRMFFPDESGKFVSDKANDKLVDTRSHFGLLVTPTGVSQVLLVLSSTQIKKSKQLMSMLSSARIQTSKGLQTPPTWMNAIKLSTTLESNDQGSWYGVKFEAGGFVTSKELYDAGKSFHDAISAGQAKANYAADNHNPASDKF